ncbi:hypothetical protein [Antarctobacter jejuensis]|uniref:hypothetical protein n=1 Tax=Antarctobacter jejuensis TaxID=1439938 RepID=UPI003FD2EE05
MKSKNPDILADKRKQNGQILMMISNYCRKHRMLDVGLRSLPMEAFEAIGNEIVDLFVERVREHSKEAAPETGTLGRKKGADRPTRPRSP